MTACGINLVWLNILIPQHADILANSLIDAKMIISLNERTE
jgi:hypothetical protein